MTILRSREIIPKKFPPSPPHSSQTLKPQTTFLQPSTPKKLHESSSMSSSTPSPPPDPDPTQEVLGLGFDSDSVSISTHTSSGTGPRRRRSLRLASKSKMGIENEQRDVTNVVDKEKESSSGSDDTGKGKSMSKRKSRVLSSVRKKGKVFDESVDEGGLGLGLGEDVEKRGEIEEKDVVDLGKLGSSSGSGSFRRRSERLVNALHEKEKRELEIDLNALPLDAVVEEGNDDDKGFSSFRKRKIEVIDVGSDSNQSVDCEREGERDDKESEEVFDLASLQLDLNLTYDHKGKSVDLEIMETDPRPAAADESTSVHGGRKYSEEEKGKGTLMEDNWLSIGHTSPVDLNLFPEEEYLVRMAEVRKVGQEEKEKEHLVKMKEAKERELLGRSIARNAAKEEAMMKKTRRRVEKQRYHDIAKENAARFARFQPDVEMDNRLHPVPRNEVPAPARAPAPEIDQEIEDWPGPFSTALKIINDRNRTMKHNAPELSSTNGVSMSAPMIDWTPSKDLGKSCSRRRAPLLLDMCLHILAKNAEAIVSLNVVPDTLRHKLSHLLCDSRRMDCHFMELLASGSPTEIRVKNCSWITEEQIIKIFDGCGTNNLMVLQLDLCGRCLPDYILNSTLARSPNSLPALASISLKGACRLTDIGLKTLVTSAPGLSSINLSQCSLISSSGINHLADSLGSFLRELYLDDGQNIDMALILPALKKLELLEVLSLAGIATVCDDLVCEFVTHCGKNMKELNFADCGNLTDTSLKAIAENCSGLCALDLSNVRKLSDSALGYLANGCRSIQTLKLCRNAFSDKAVAAFLEASGDPLTELSLNNVKKVGHNTALSLARRCSRNLRCLDLSWCRNLADPAVGLIVDNCSSLRMLKLFGCTQLTKVFVDGHSNPLVRIIGLNLTPILEHLDVLSLEEGPLRYSSVPHCS